MNATTPTIIDRPGIYDLDADTYHRDPAPEPSLSSTIARVMIKESPIHAWTKCPRLNPAWEPEDKKAFDIGRAAHRAILGKGGDYVAIPDNLLASDGAASTKAAKEFTEQARASGLTPLKAAEVDQIAIISDRVRARLDVMGIRLDMARSEVSALAMVDDVWCRCMVDNAPEDPRLPLYDLKTKTGSVHPDALVKTIADMGYDIQAAHYLRVWKEATGEDRAFRFIFVEKSAPFEVGVAELYADGENRPASRYEPDEPFSPDWFADADQKLERARRQWRACLDADEWPGYPARVALIGAPVWHRRNNAAACDFDPILPKAPSAEAMRRAAEWQSQN